MLYSFPTAAFRVRRYFEGVQNNPQKQGELFGIKVNTPHIGDSISSDLRLN